MNLLLNLILGLIWFGISLGIQTMILFFLLYESCPEVFYWLAGINALIQLAVWIWWVLYRWHYWSFFWRPWLWMR